mmetsp:Transcript_168/g.636  ORF Transcript_168/g.636 Transcript_168/m.636 type:complete len:250 (-) Transcript_168:728-1477(-)
MLESLKDSSTHLGKCPLPSRDISLSAPPVTGDPAIAALASSFHDDARINASVGSLRGLGLSNTSGAGLAVGYQSRQLPAVASSMSYSGLVIGRGTNASASAVTAPPHTSILLRYDSIASERAMCSYVSPPRPLPPYLGTTYDTPWPIIMGAAASYSSSIISATASTSKPASAGGPAIATAPRAASRAAASRSLFLAFELAFWPEALRPATAPPLRPLPLRVGAPLLMLPEDVLACGTGPAAPFSVLRSA